MQKIFCPIYKKYFLLLANPHILFFSFIFHNHFLNSITTTSLIPHSNPILQKKPLLCALGAHINEGNIVGSDIELEEVSLEDAFLALRMTEDMLIWLYQTATI